jgi:hypothetical protein
MHSADVGVIQAERRLRLMEEAMSLLFIGSEGMKKLQGDRAAGSSVTGFVDDSYPTFTELLENLAISNRSPYHTEPPDPGSDLLRRIVSRLRALTFGAFYRSHVWNGSRSQNGPEGPAKTPRAAEPVQLPKRHGVFVGGFLCTRVCA